jgi:hypothetical protein
LTSGGNGKSLEGRTDFPRLSKEFTMRKLVMASALLLIGALFSSLSCAAAAEKDDTGWVQLFNGKDLTGWKVHPNPNPAITEVIKVEKDGKVVGFDGKLKDGTTTHLWRVEDGLLIGGGPSSHLFTERGDYVNFKYRVEAKINDHGNSGQYFRTEFGPGFPKGYEAQINATHKDRVKTGSLYPAQKDLREIMSIQVLDNAPHKPDEFFTQEVTCIGDTITIKVNGKVTVDNFKDPMARYTKGHFALQAHDPGSIMTFKKVEVKELPAN